jgi:hypothetical protein
VTLSLATFGDESNVSFPADLRDLTAEERPKVDANHGAVPDRLQSSLMQHLVDRKYACPPHWGTALAPYAITHSVGQVRDLHKCALSHSRTRRTKCLTSCRSGTGSCSGLETWGRGESCAPHVGERLR